MQAQKLIKIGENYLTIANYKEPLKAIQQSEGYGFYGTLLMTPRGESVMCAYCGILCQDLGRHILNSHKEQFPTVRDYREKYQLAYTTSLLSETERISRKERKLKYLATLTKKQMQQRLQFARQGLLERRNYQPKLTLESKNKRGTCPDQLLDKILKVKEEIGHTPNLKEFIKATGGQRFKHLIFSTFGSWNNAIELLGLPVNIPKRSSLSGAPRIYTDEYLLESLRMFAEQNKTVPTASDCKRGLLPSWEVYKKRFNGFERARQLAGVYSYINN